MYVEKSFGSASNAIDQVFTSSGRLIRSPDESIASLTKLAATLLIEANRPVIETDDHRLGLRVVINCLVGIFTTETAFLVSTKRLARHKIIITVDPDRSGLHLPGEAMGTV